MEEIKEVEPLRVFNINQKKIIKLFFVIFSTLIIYWTINATMDIILKRSIYLMLVFSICAVIYPFNKSKKYKRISTLIDILVVFFTVICSIYIIYDPYSRFMRLSLLNKYDVLLGLIMVIIALDIGRRVIGWALTLTAISVIIYALFGNLIPGHFGNPGFELSSIISQIYAGLEGFYGMASNVMIIYVAPFIILGAFLEKVGASEFFMNLAFSSTRNSIGGPAKAAVISSALMGSISGSAIANVTSTGVFTIPLMIKIGYKPYMAGAIEAAASSGGIIMPPVMGAVAFLMVEFTQIPYLTIIAVAAVPSILYYISVFSFVHIRAKKQNYGIFKETEVRPLKEILRDGWFYFFSLIMIIVSMIFGYPPNIAALAGITVLLIADIIKKKKFDYKAYYESLALGGENTIKIGSVVGCIGIILAIVGMTGLGLKLSWILTSLSMENAFLAILLTGLISIILGMGLPSSASYIILVVISGPALIDMGFPVIIVHFILIWSCILANVTPPVGMAGIVAAGIANANPMKTMLTSSILANSLFILPFLFFYRPGLLFQDTFFSSIETIISVLLGLISFTLFFENYFLKKTCLFERILLFLSIFAFYYPSIILNLFGSILLVFVYIKQKNQLKKLINS